jgi:integrase
VEEGGVNIDAAIAEFEQGFFCDLMEGERSSSRMTTWKSAYLPYYRRLQETAAGGPLSVAALTAALETYKPGSRSKQMASTVFAKLARSANIQLPDEWGLEAKSWKPPQNTSKEPPADESVIASCLDKIPSQQWRNAFALMAVYGLKNYEPFFIDLEHLQSSQSLTAKVRAIEPDDARYVWPAPPDWAKRFGIGSICRPDDLPSVTTDLGVTSLQQIGRRCAEQFRRYGLSLTPSNLRHSWGKRAIAHGVPDTLAAKMLGIDITKYVLNYRAEIEDRDKLLLASFLNLSQAPF